MSNNINKELLIFRYLSEEANDAEHQLLIELMESDPTFRKEFIETRDIWNLAGSHEFDSTKAFVRFSQKLKNNNHNQKVLNPKRKVWLKLASVAASLIIVFLLGKMFLANEDNAVSYYSYQTEVGERRLVFLPDSTQVWLNADTKLSYSSDYNKNNRRVKLTGEAFFDVRHNVKKPFVVMSGQHTVKVLGTRFKLSALPNKQHVETILEEGKVQILVLDKQLSCILSPGQKSVYNKVSHQLQKLDETNMSVHTALSKGQLVFRNEPLNTLAARLENWYGVNIELDDKVGDLRFTGIIDDEALEELLEIMNMSNGIRYTKANGVVYITIN